MNKLYRFPVMIAHGLAVVLMVACAPAAPESTLTPTTGVEPSETVASATPTSTSVPTDTSIPPTDTPGPTRTPTDMPRPSLGAGPFRAVVPIDDVIPGEIGGLHTTPDGTLWLYSDQAVARLQADETWELFLPEYEGAFAGIDALGRVWVAEFDLTGIAVWDGQDWTRYGEESGWVPPGPGWYSSRPVKSGPYIDARGRLWLATAADVRAFDGQQWFIFDSEAMGMGPPEAAELDYDLQVYEDLIWVGACEFTGIGPGPGHGVRWFDGEWHGGDSPIATGCVTALTIDPAGQMWIGYRRLLWKTDPHGEAWIYISMPEEALGGMNSGYPVALIAGPSGDLWAAYMFCGRVCCEGPLTFFHIEGGVWNQIAQTVPYYPGLQLIMLGPDGTPWFFSAGGIDRVIDNEREPAASLIPLFVAQDRAGQMWFIAEQDGQNWLWTLDGGG